MNKYINNLKEKERKKVKRKEKIRKYKRWRFVEVVITF